MFDQPGVWPQDFFFAGGRPVGRGGNPVCCVSTRPRVTLEVLAPTGVEFLRRALT